MTEIPRILLMIDKSRAWDRGLLIGIARYSQINKPWTFFTKPAAYLSKVGHKKLVKEILQWKPDGAIMTQTETIPEIANLGIPCVITNTTEPLAGSPCVLIDNGAVGSLAAKYLVEKGFKSFAYCGFKDKLWSDCRGESFSITLKKSGYDVVEYIPGRSKNSKQEHLVGWLSSLAKPLALMCCNDDRAQDVLQACKVAAIRVPDEIAVLGVDNDQLVCDLSDPPLSSIALNSEKGGYQIAKALHDIMSGQKPAENIVIKPTFVEERLSTDTLAIEDHVVADAIHYIKLNANRSLQVDDVANGVAVSKRTLQQRFRKSLGRSVFDEINSVRIEKMAKMLISTNLSVAQIARIMGFPGFEHVSRSFKKLKGMSPLEYRKENSEI